MSMGRIYMCMMHHAWALYAPSLRIYTKVCTLHSHTGYTAYSPGIRVSYTVDMLVSMLVEILATGIPCALCLCPMYVVLTVTDSRQ
jgi:hypothetical protein